MQGFIESQFRYWESFNFSNIFPQIDKLKLVNRLFLRGELIYNGRMDPTKLSWLAEGVLPILKSLDDFERFHLFILENRSVLAKSFDYFTIIMSVRVGAEGLAAPSAHLCFCVFV